MSGRIRTRCSEARGRRAAAARTALLLAAAGLMVSAPIARAQVDPEKRQLIQLGYNQPFEGRGPLSGYAFYYYNRPAFIRSNLTLRLAVAPVYLDSELGFRGVITPDTDLGLGVAGGGYAASYSEVRQGNLIKEESFEGHDAKVSFNLYHRFNPQARIPLYAVIRNDLQYAFFKKDDDTSPYFELPDDQPNYQLRAGLRLGGTEPLMLPAVAMELSAWYEGQFRGRPGRYGYNDDRAIEPTSHLFWGRALFAYTTERRGDNFNLSITLGTSLHPDRFSAYRLGGFLPLISEFPLTLPGYYFQEITAERCALFSGSYVFPLDRNRCWSLFAGGSSAWVDYLPGFEQPGNWVSGLGGGIIFRSPSGAWQVLAGYGYGFDAIRGGDKGAQNIGILVQFDFERAKADILSPGANPTRSRGLPALLRFFR